MEYHYWIITSDTSINYDENALKGIKINFSINRLSKNGKIKKEFQEDRWQVLKLPKWNNPWSVF